MVGDRVILQSDPLFVDLTDLRNLAQYYGMHIDDPLYDLVPDGEIDVYDLVRLSHDIE